MPLLEVTEPAYDDVDRLEIQKSTTATRLRAFLVTQADIMQEDVWHRLGTDSSDPGRPSTILSAKYTTAGNNVKGEPNPKLYHLDLLEKQGRSQTSLIISAGQVLATHYTITEGGLLLRATELGADDTADALARAALVVDEGTVRERIECLRSSHSTIDDRIHQIESEYDERRRTLPMGPYFTHPKIVQTQNQVERTKALLWLPPEHIRDRSTEIPLVCRALAGVAMTSSARN